MVSLGAVDLVNFIPFWGFFFSFVFYQKVVREKGENGIGGSDFDDVRGGGCAQTAREAPQ